MTRTGMPKGPIKSTDPAAILDAVVQRVSATQPYLSPTPEQRAEAGLGLARMIIGDQAGAAETLTPLDFSVSAGMDPATGRQYALAVSAAAGERAWGLYLVDLSEPARLCIAVPHPRSDADCEHLALRLWRAVPGSILALAAVHRKAAGGTADHARNLESVFHHLWSEVLGPRGVPQVQIHGFANGTAAEQVVVSTGAGPVSPAAERIATEIAATGLVVTRNWDNAADPELRAGRNQQGIAAGAQGWVWAHLEFNRTVRSDPARWHPAIDAVAAADPGLLARARPSPGGPGREPSPATGEGTIGIDAADGDYFRIALTADRLLVAPVNGTDGQRILVEARATGGERKLSLHPAILLGNGIRTSITIPAGRRWFGELVFIRSTGWVNILSAVQGVNGLAHS